MQKQSGHGTTALICVATLAAAALALFGITALETSRKQSRIEAVALMTTGRVKEELKRMAADLEMTGHNAASSPRLVAAVRANVTPSTLRDIFDNESWWQPYREAFSTQALATGASPAEILSGAKLDVQALTQLVAHARSRGRATAELVVTAQKLYEVVAAPMALADTTSAPVLILGRPFGTLQLAQLAQRLDEGAVGLFHKQRPLAMTGARDASQRLRREPLASDASRIELPEQIALVARAAEPRADRSWALTLALLRVAVCLIASLVMGAVVLGRRRPTAALPVSTEAPAPPAPSVGRYVFLDKIGGGGMAEVFLAVARGEQGFKRPCVVKRLRPELAENPAIVAQFTDEATLSSSLVHSNIIPIYDFGRIDEQYFIVEEYVPGRDLGKLAQRLLERGQGPMAPSAVAHAACEVLNALDYAHHKLGVDGRPMGLVHRDVSPENVIVSVQGEVKLLDFGVLKATQGRSTKTEVGALKGSVSFMSPEQARCVEVDARADLFSLGLVMYFCLTGEALYEGTSSYQILVKAGSGLGINEQMRLAALPAGFGDVLKRALAPLIEDRFQTAMEFAAALKPLAAGGGACLRHMMDDLFGAELHVEQEMLRHGIRNTQGHYRMTDKSNRARTGTITETSSLVSTVVAAHAGRGS